MIQLRNLQNLKLIPIYLKEIPIKELIKDIILINYFSDTNPWVCVSCNPDDTFFEASYDLLNDIRMYNSYINYVFLSAVQKCT